MENIARTSATASILITGKGDITINMAMQIVMSIRKMLDFFCQGDGRGAKITIAENNKINIFRRGCDSNPTEPAAAHAAARENITSIVNPKSAFVSAVDSCLRPSCCNNFLWLT